MYVCKAVCIHEQETQTLAHMLETSHLRMQEVLYRTYKLAFMKQYIGFLCRIYGRVSRTRVGIAEWIFGLICLQIACDAKRFKTNKHRYVTLNKQLLKYKCTYINANK